MNMPLKEFIRRVNSEHGKLKLAAFYSLDIDRPLSIEMRYVASQYKDRLSDDGWKDINDAIDYYSKETMGISTDFHLYRRGIIEIKIASMNHNYSESIIISVLDRIIKAFFPN